MAKKNKKPSRNVLVVGKTQTKGRGKNKQTTVKPTRGKLSTRLYCVALTKEKRGAKARFQCFGSFEEASVALLDPAKLPVPAARPPAFSKASLEAMEKAMSGLSGLRGALPARGRRRGLRGTPEEHAQAAWDLTDLAENERDAFDRTSYATRALEEMVWAPHDDDLQRRALEIVQAGRAAHDEPTERRMIRRQARRAIRR